MAPAAGPPLPGLLRIEHANRRLARGARGLVQPDIAFERVGQIGSVWRVQRLVVSELLFRRERQRFEIIPPGDVAATKLARIEPVARQDLVKQLLDTPQLELTQLWPLQSLAARIKKSTRASHGHVFGLYVRWSDRVDLRRGPVRGKSCFWHRFCLPPSPMESLKAHLAAFQRSRAGLFVKKVMDDQAPNLAALLAWGTLSALLPLLLGVLSVAGIILRDQKRLDDLSTTLLFLVPQQSAGPIVDAIKSVREASAAPIGIIALLLLLLSGSSFFSNMS